MTTAAPSSAPELVARRIRKALEFVGTTRTTLYFADDGTRVGREGRAFYTGPQDYAFSIVYPYRPSFVSICDMVRDRRRTSEQITYDEERWIHDRRIEEAAGPSVFDEVSRTVAVAA